MSSVMNYLSNILQLRLDHMFHESRTYRKYYTLHSVIKGLSISNRGGADVFLSKVIDSWNPHKIW